MNLRLLINGEEYDFNEKINFQLHPSNNNTITFNNVIRKADNYYPKNVTNPKIPEAYSLGEVYDGDELLFFGVISATGRFSLMPNEIKTFSVQMFDVRKWLSNLKPVNLVFFEESPENIVRRMLLALNERLLAIGELSFTNDKNIKAYSLIDKTPYQILKEVIAPITNSFLYFTVKENKLLINFKSLDDLLNNSSPIELNTSNYEFLKDKKIISINYENDIDGYANVVRYASDNIVSTKPLVEDIEIKDQTSLIVFEPIVKIDKENSYLYDRLNPSNKQAVEFLETDKLDSGKYFDVLWTKDSNSLKVREGLLNQNQNLHIQYYTKRNWTIELSNNEEISKISSLSNTNGEIYLYDKFNDLSSSEDLIRKTTHKLSISSKPRHTLTIESREKIWNLLDYVKVNTKQNELNGYYVVHRINGDFQVNDKIFFGSYTYILKQTFDINDYINLFDNQSYRTNSVYEDDETNLVLTETFSGNINLISEINESEVNDYENSSQNTLQQPLQTPLANPNVNIKYKLLVVQDEN